MHSVKVKTAELLAKLEANRAEHKGLFEQAQAKYRDRVIEELDAMLAAAKKGDSLRTQVRLVAPEDHTADYDRVIAMLEMSVDAEVTLDAASFQQYVLNQWAWFARAMALNTTYSSGGKVDA